MSAYQEVTEAVRSLAVEGVDMNLLENRSTTRQDAVFPNNGFSTHPDGRIALYPMAAPNRRAKRREDVLALSMTAYAALTVDQKEQIEQTTRLVPLNVPTIEMAGGSVRCMLAGIHLPSR